MLPQRTHDPVAFADLRTLPIIRSVRADLGCSPERLFQSFGDAGELKRWVDLDVNWLTEHRSESARREIGAFPLYATEVFSVWDPPGRMFFHFERSSLFMVRQFAEEWAIEATANGCRFEWTVGLRMRRGAGWLGGVIADKVADTVAEGIPELRRVVMESP